MTDDFEYDHAKLRWHCRRGVKELDVVLSEYLQNHYASADKSGQLAFQQLLQLEDPELMSLVMDNHQTDNLEHARVLEIMRSLFST